MEKIRLDLDALAAESFPLADARAEGGGTVAACEAAQTRNCATPLCTAGIDCL